MRHGKYRFILAFAVPPLALYAIFVIGPYAQAFPIAFTEWGGFSSEAAYVGWRNFTKLVTDDVFWNALRNNAYLLILLPTVTILLGLFFATMINIGGRRGRASIGGARGSAVYRLVYFFPQVLSVAIIAVLWKQMYNPIGGLINGTLSALGLMDPEKPITWLANGRLSFWAVLIVMIWSNVGFYVVLFSAAMQSIPKEIYEAVMIDGAGRFATFWRITLPLMREVVQVAWVFLAIIAIDGFALLQIMTEAVPGAHTDVAGLAVYRSAFTESQFGYASAMGVVMFFLTLTVAVLAMRISRRERVEL